ncbi:MAG: HAD family hydrolase [Anaerolineae bacterium]
MRGMEGTPVVRAILWDMDGVLTDSGDAHFSAWQALFDELGGSVSREQFNETFGMANPAILQRWLGKDTPDARIQAVAARKEQLFRERIRSGVRILPGVEQWLARARDQGYRQVVASSGEMANIAAVVSTFSLGNWFDALLSGAFLPRSKPDPALFLQAAAAVGAAPSDCLVVEDGIVGVEAARRAGMRCLAVTTTHPADRLSAADQVVDSLADLTENALERLFGLM